MTSSNMNVCTYKHIQSILATQWYSFYFARYLNVVQAVFEKLSLIFQRVNKSQLLTETLYISLKFNFSPTSFSPQGRL